MENATITKKTEGFTPEQESTRANLKRLAKENCKKCSGRGYTGVMKGAANTLERERFVACGCAVKNYAKVKKLVAEKQLRDAMAQMRRPWWKKLMFWK